MFDHRTIAHRAGQLVVCLVLLAMYTPVAMIFVYSFNESRIGSVWTGFSARWYGELFRRRDLWDGLKVSLGVGFVASTISVALGTLAAIGLKQWRVHPRRLARGLLGLPLVVPDMVIAISLGVFFHSAGLRQGMVTVVLAHVTFGVSYAFVIMAAAVNDLDENLTAAALDCGATPRQVFFNVILPILAPSLVVAWLLVFTLSFDDFLITFFAKGPGMDTLPIKIYSRMRFGVRPDTNALFVLLFLMTVASMVVAGRVIRLWGAPPRS